MEIISVCVFSGLYGEAILVSVIFVRQYGQAAYGSDGCWRKFLVLSGFAKTFLHDAFGQVYVFFPSFLYKADYYLMQLLTYSIDEFKIKTLVIRHCMFELETLVSLNRQHLQSNQKQSIRRLLRFLSLL